MADKSGDLFLHRWKLLIQGVAELPGTNIRYHKTNLGHIKHNSSSIFAWKIATLELFLGSKITIGFTRVSPRGTVYSSHSYFIAIWPIKLVLMTPSSPIYISCCTISIQYFTYCLLLWVSTSLPVSLHTHVPTNVTDCRPKWLESLFFIFFLSVIQLLWQCNHHTWNGNL